MKPYSHVISGFVLAGLLLIVGCAGLGRAKRPMSGKIQIRPYIWAGPYAEMRSSLYKHDPGLCAEVRASWMAKGERIIIRSSEIVGYDGGYLYDDHIPVLDLEGRGKDYQHIPFQFNAEKAPDALSANCVVPGKGQFQVELIAGEDFVDIELIVRNDLSVEMGFVDSAFCVVGYDSPSIGDAALEHTYLFDGQQLRTLADISGIGKSQIFHVAGCERFIPPPMQDLSWSPVEAKAPIVLVESVCGTYTAAIGFERAHCIYSGTHNKCFHADPCFGCNIEPKEQRRIRGRLYLMKGSALQVLSRFRREFDL